MTLQLGEVVIDCADHDVVCAFWAAALGGWERRAVNEQYALLVPPPEQRTGDGPHPLPILFQKVPEAKVVKNRVHLDLRADDLAAEVTRLVGLGASIVAERSLGDLRWVVLADPEGNELCVAQG